MVSPHTKASLSPARRQLLERLQQINFGRLVNLAVRNGEPVFDPPPRIFREIKFGGENGPRPEAAINNFSLKSQIVELFRELDELRDGTIEVLQIAHGLPLMMTVETAA